ncbi:hypothetical protein TNIN_177761 [Trichonephila inaurata madagascariensis]|uniref:Uncharacterized protein n=1 Tax=Trichonephila inaurata madagascariensis TaxID=2747483 RepID=A0A8X6X8A9_9ARAC|nr:hypothetical protein TNIN_177761 [Trichonephila inaurata madagascariensis]
MDSQPPLHPSLPCKSKSKRIRFKAFLPECLFTQLTSKREHTRIQNKHGARLSVVYGPLGNRCFGNDPAQTRAGNNAGMRYVPLFPTANQKEITS